MAKKYTQELSDWLSKEGQQRNRQDAAAVRFLALKKDVSEAIDAGYSLTVIWEHMRATGKLDFGYETFRKHVHRYIKGAPRPDLKKPTPTAPASPDSQSASFSSRAPSSALSGFTFEAKPNKKDLI